MTNNNNDTTSSNKLPLTPLQRHDIISKWEHPTRPTPTPQTTGEGYDFTIDTNLSEEMQQYMEGKRQFTTLLPQETQTHIKEAQQHYTNSELPTPDPLYERPTNPNPGRAHHTPLSQSQPQQPRTEDPFGDNPTKPQRTGNDVYEKIKQRKQKDIAALKKK